MPETSGVARRFSKSLRAPKSKHYLIASGSTPAETGARGGASAAFSSASNRPALASRCVSFGRASSRLVSVVSCHFVCAISPSLVECWTSAWPDSIAFISLSAARDQKRVALGRAWHTFTFRSRLFDHSNSCFLFSPSRCSTRRPVLPVQWVTFSLISLTERLQRAPGELLQLIQTVPFKLTLQAWKMAPLQRNNAQPAVILEWRESSAMLVWSIWTGLFQKRDRSKGWKLG